MRIENIHAVRERIRQVRIELARLRAMERLAREVQLIERDGRSTAAQQQRRAGGEGRQQ